MATDRGLLTPPISAAAPRAAAAVFLTTAGWAGVPVQPLAGDASFRRYFRLEAPGRRAVLMDAPPPHEDVRPFVRVAHWLREQGLSAPAVFAADEEQGFLLLEDFGDRLLGPELAAGRADEMDCYRRAVLLLARLQQAPAPAFLGSYDRDALLREVLLFPDWYARAAGIAVDRDAYAAAWDMAWQPVVAAAQRRPVLVLRDYHAENLLLLDRPGDSGIGLLDFQDALAGHPAYDLVSLLEDARRTVSPALEQQMIDCFLDATGHDRAGFLRDYAILGAQRNVKILGIFVRLRDRDARPGYVERLPRVWDCLERNLAHPHLAPVARWFEAHVPQSRRQPWCTQ
jgi:aminoglycoside/choline kinase family phosphotransferase